MGFNFCMNCGERLDPSDKFCTNCGTKVGEAGSGKISDKDFFLKYTIKIENLKEEYEVKVAKALELIKKEFDPSEISYSNFISTINESNNVFYNNVEVAMDIIELASEPSVKIKGELDSKINSLKMIIDKLKEFIDELICNIADKSEHDVENLANELDNLINSVKDY